MLLRVGKKICIFFLFTFCCRAKSLDDQPLCNHYILLEWESNYRLGVDKDGVSCGSFGGSIGGCIAGGESDDGKLRKIGLW